MGTNVLENMIYSFCHNSFKKRYEYGPVWTFEIRKHNFFQQLQKLCF